LNAILTLLRFKKKLQQKEELDMQLQEIEDSISLLKFINACTNKECTGKQCHSQTKSTHTQTEVHLPLTQQLMTTSLTRLQLEAEERKKRIFRSFRKK